MAEKTERGKTSTLEKRGGYEPGPKKLSDLKPPPRTPGAGVRPTSDDSPKN